MLTTSGIYTCQWIIVHNNGSEVDNLIGKDIIASWQVKYRNNIEGFIERGKIAECRYGMHGLQCIHIHFNHTVDCNFGNELYTDAIQEIDGKLYINCY